jgi:uncharacterized protein (TIGR03086 family)
MLLDHLSDSIAALQEAIVTARVGAGAAIDRSRGRHDPVARLRRRATGLLGSCAAVGPLDCLVTIGDRELTASMVALTGSIEIAVHGWDISVTCGAGRPLPPNLAAALATVAPRLITPETRPGLFADPIRLPGPSGPGDELLAFLGRRPRLAAPGSGGA